MINVHGITIYEVYPRIMTYYSCREGRSDAQISSNEMAIPYGSRSASNAVLMRFIKGYKGLNDPKHLPFLHHYSLRKKENLTHRSLHTKTIIIWQSPSFS